MARKNQKKAPMRRQIYLMERVTGKTWKSVINGKREIKIGVSKDSFRRNVDVDLGIPGRVVLIDKFQVNAATRVETSLHRKYKAYNFHVKGAEKGAGGTEFHRLSSRQVDSIIKQLIVIEREGYKSIKNSEWGGPDVKTPPIILVFFLSIALMIVIHYLQNQ